MSALFKKPEPEPFKLFDGAVLQQISATMMGEYRRCAFMAGLRRVVGLRKKGKRYFAKGGAFDVATEHAFRLVGQGKKVNPDDLVDLALKTYDERAKEDEIQATEVEKIDDRDALKRSLPIYWNKLGKNVRVSTEYEPQSEIVVTLPSGLKVISVLDVVEEVGSKCLRVVDVKTASSVWKKGKEKEEFQSDIYPWALSQSTKKKVVGIGFHITVPQKTGANVEERTQEIRPDRMKALPVLTQVYGDAYSDLYKRGGMAPPCVGKFTCSFCDYVSECEAQFGGKRPTFSNGEE